MKESLLRAFSFFNLIGRAMLGREKNFNSGSINRSIVLLSVPMVAELTMESLFVCSNLFFVSRLGANAISIAGATTSFITFCYSVAVGLSIAASAMISRRVGEKKFEDAGLTTMQVIYILLPVATGISIICYINAEYIMRYLGFSTEMIDQGLAYTKMMFISCGFLILRTVLNGVFRGAGNASVAMKVLWLSNAINIVLCPIFIFGWGGVPAYGLLGVGIATVIARLIGVCYQAWYLISGKTIIKIAKAQLVFSVTILKRILKLTLAGTVQFIIPASSWVFMIKIISQFGEDALAGYVLAQRITSVATIPAWGIGNAAGILTGHNLGAKQLDRAEKSVWRAGVINTGFLITIAVCWSFLSAPVVSFFSNVPEVVDYSTTYINFISIAYVLLGYTMVISKSLNAAGEVKIVTWLYVFIFYILQLPLAYLLSITFELGPTGCFVAILSSEIVLAAICIFIFRKGKWKYTKI